MKSLRWLLPILTLTSLLLTGCGGGGGGGAKVNSDTSVLTIPANATSDTSKDFGDYAVTVPMSAFPAGGRVTITRSSTSALPQAPGISSIGPMSDIEITCSTQPNSPIAIDLPALSSQRGVGDVMHMVVRKTSDGWKRVTASAVNVGHLTADAAEFVFSGGEWHWAKGTILRIVLSDYDHTTTLNQFGSDDNSANATRVLVVVHGFNSTEAAMHKAAQRFQQLHRYRKIFIFSYDWRVDCAESASALGNELDSLKGQGYDIDILAHSMGVVVSRYALERLGHTRNVRSLFAVCGANQGSYWAKLDFIKALQEDYLNCLPEDARPGAIATDTIPSAACLESGSYFLSSLNAPSSNSQRGAVDYYVFGGTFDEIVGFNSGYGWDVNFNALTAGTVKRFSEPVMHGTLMQDDDGLNTLVSRLELRNTGPVWLWAEPNPTEASYDQWYHTIHIENLSQSYLTLKDLSFDYFDGDGDWDGLSWYDPYAGIYPRDYYEWDYSLGPGASVTINCSTFINDFTPIDDLVPYLQTGSTVLALRYSDGSHEYLETYSIARTHDGQLPFDPKLRSYPLRSADKARMALPLSKSAKAKFLAQGGKGK